jgi:hypothetical protein
MSTMTNRQAVFDAHPDWFAIYGGKPDFKPGDSKCQLYYSNDQLFRETVRWARAMLDTYQLETVSIMPPDGYTSICQCQKCRPSRTYSKPETQALAHDRPISTRGTRRNAASGGNQSRTEFIPF